jgi:hypothetical protein
MREDAERSSEQQLSSRMSSSAVGFTPTTTLVDDSDVAALQPGSALKVITDALVQRANPQAMDALTELQCARLENLARCEEVLQAAALMTPAGPSARVGGTVRGKLVKPGKIHTQVQNPEKKNAAKRKISLVVKPSK